MNFRNAFSRFLSTIVLLTLSLFFLTSGRISARESFCEFHHITDFERSRFNEIIWFWTYDSLYGRVHTNETFGLKYSPHFYGQISVSANDFLYYEPGNIHMEFPPQYGAPIRRFPEEYTLGREEGLMIHDEDSTSQYRILLDGDIAELHTWADGEPYEEVEVMIEAIEIVDNPCIFVDGNLEVMGILDGELTIGCSRDIRLIDDVRYIEASDDDGSFDEEECDDILGLVSEGNVLVANTWANGREHGSRDDSIVLTAAILALSESFTFEDQNDDWEIYQGPSPDERGIIYLKGSIAQKRRGYVHRSNHQGTGYRKHFHPDGRLQELRPPLFPEIPQQDIPGEGNYLYLNAEDSPYRVIGCEGSYDSVFADPGTEIIFTEDNHLEMNQLTLTGELDNPVSIGRDNSQFAGARGIHVSGEDGWALLNHVRFDSSSRFAAHLSRCVIAENCIFENEVHLDAIEDTVIFRNCEFRNIVRIEANADVIIESCIFDSLLTLELNRGSTVHGLVSASMFSNGLNINCSTNNEASVINCVIEGSAVLEGNNLTNVELYNNCFLNSDGNGIDISIPGDVVMVNNIIANHQYGVVNNVEANVTFRFNDLWNNAVDDLSNVEPGEGTIYSDPLFVDPDNGSYYLAYESPCIDAGDPDFPRDPDGSIVEIGAYYYDHNVDVSEPVTMPEEFEVVAYPNPFNSSLTINIESGNFGKTDLTVYDILGRKVYSRRLNERRFSVDGESLGGSGVYFIHIKSGDLSKTMKVLYLP